MTQVSKPKWVTVLEEEDWKQFNKNENENDKKSSRSCTEVREDRKIKQQRKLNNK